MFAKQTINKIYWQINLMERIWQIYTDFTLILTLKNFEFIKEHSFNQVPLSSRFPYTIPNLSNTTLAILKNASWL